MEIKKQENAKKRIFSKGMGMSMFGRSEKDAITDPTGSLGLIVNLCLVAIGFLFGGCHTFFGAYPLAIGFLAVLPSGVWQALLGAVGGALTLGRAGIIYGMISVLVVFLRIVISGNGKRAPGEDSLFSESVLLRACCALIGGFVAAAYELLLEGVSMAGVLFGICMILIPPIVTLVLSGVFSHGIGVRELIFSKGGNILKNDESVGKKRIFYKISLLSFLILISLGMNKYEIFGISFSFIFAGAVTLFSAGRFGALVGAIVGFSSSVLVSGIYSPAFAIAGAVFGVLYDIGVVYALLASGILLSVWGAYVGGVSGFLSVLPEFLISSSLMLPLFKYIERECVPEGKTKESVEKKATDMVGTMALAYRNRQSLYIDSLSDSLKDIPDLLYDFSGDEFLKHEYLGFAKMICETCEEILKEREMDEGLTDLLEEVFRENGFENGVIRAFGKRKKYIICSGEDKSGVMITSPSLKKGIENVSNLRFSEPKYFRRETMVLMECESVAKYKIYGAIADSSLKSSEVSGDSSSVFEAAGNFAYAIISDGMGSGSEAAKTSRFVTEFIRRFSSSSVSLTTIMHILNMLIVKNGSECSATVDVFSLDLINGDAFFFKSGAVCSFIKRNSSLFRIKSETMPIGLLSRIDAEKIAVSVKGGDYVILMSDGVLQSSDDSSWLIELLNSEPLGNVKEYANLILEESRKYSFDDDKTVIVLKVEDI